MKLFIHDAKHDVVLAETDLGDLTESEEALVNGIFSFLEEHDVSSRYARPVLADGYTQVTDEDAPDYGITFH